MVSEKHTIETFAKQQGLTRQSAINKLSKLKKQGYAQVSGGGEQKRIYTISKTKQKETNGFFDILNKYSREKISPYFKHQVIGRYDTEKAIIDGLQLKQNIRLRHAMYHLFRHIKDWKLLFDLAKKNKVTNKLYSLYCEAKKNVKVRKLPKRYER